MTQICAWPNCEEEAEFPAPVDPRDLRKRQYFCKQHIREFNRKWNGLDGLDAQEIENIQFGDATWNRPTWPLGSNPLNKATNFFESADDLFDFFKQRTAEAPQHYKEAPLKELPADVAESCAIFDLKQPPTKDELKKIYHKLIKQHHPDLNGGTKKAEDHVKKINVAYKILQDFLERTL